MLLGCHGSQEKFNIKENFTRWDTEPISYLQVIDHHAKRNQSKSSTSALSFRSDPKRLQPLLSFPQICKEIKSFLADLWLKLCLKDLSSCLVHRHDSISSLKLHLQKQVVSMIFLKKHCLKIMIYLITVLIPHIVL